DPLEHSLLFERFLHPERRPMPDIDLDLDERKRGDMIRSATERYAAARAAQILTFGTTEAAAATERATRILGYPYALGDKITKAFPPAVGGKEIPLSAVFDESHPRYNEAAELRQLIESNPDVRKVYETASGLEGLTRGTGVHAAGVILSAEPLLDV